MKLTNTLGQNQVNSTTTGKKMRLSENATSRVFQLFTKNVYSNPIGTVVREITSNCFDSHVEAGVDTPVVIRKNHDPATNQYSISFIDYGVGMSPDRVENIYGVYFESTKNASNDEIGGFGIGGKTPLAYMRKTGEGEGEYDNSFLVITNYNGIKYTYNIVEGEESPVIFPMGQEETKERNGTEICVPMLQRDISSFESELKRQLYYFDNIVFEGWGDYVQNDYQIIRGKTFLYRGDDLDSKIHVCLGKVYYPINFDTMGLSYYDYQIPVAINVPIGAINVTVSREQLDYSQETITYLKKRIEEVKDELREMLSKQYDHIVTLEDYFKTKNNFGTLYLTETKTLNLRRLISNKELDFSQYKYNNFDTPSDSELFKAFFNVTCYGKRELKGYSRNDFEQLEKSYNGLMQVKNVYFSDDRNYSRKRMKQAYLRSEHGRFYVITKREMAMEKHTVSSLFNAHFDDTEKYLSSETYKKVLEMQEEFFGIVRSHSNDYNTVEIPDDFTLDYGKPKISAEIKNTTIPVKLYGSYGKTRVKVSTLINFKGIIFYGNTDENNLVDTCYDVFRALYGSDHIATNYSSYRDSFGGKNGVMFITLAKNNMKYVQYFRRALPISRFYHKMVARKEQEITETYRTSNFRERWNDISDFYKSKFFAEISTKWINKVDEVKTFIDALKAKDNGNSRRDIYHYKHYLAKYINFDNLTLTVEEKKVDKMLNEIKKLEDDNRQILKYFNTPSRGWHIIDGETDKNILVPILKKSMSL